LCFNLFAQNIPSYVPTNGLVGWWPFNGNANDESGNGNNGTVNGAILTTDRFGNDGKAYSFDGVSNYILVNNSFVYDAYFLKKGDIIQFKNYNLINYKNNYLINSGLDFLHSFIEIDYYTNCIIILKDLNTLSVEDCFLILNNQSINLKNLFYYIKTK